jgi:hypothetical protein
VVVRHFSLGLGRGRAFLFGGEDFGVGGFGGGGSGDYVEGGVDVFGYGGEADFSAAGLVAQLHWNVLGTEWRGGEDGERQEDGDVAGVDVELFVFGEGEGLQRAFRISHGSEFEARGNFGAEVGGDQVIFGDFAGVDVKAVADFEDYGNLEGHAARDGIVGGVGLGGDDVFAGRSLRACW